MFSTRRRTERESIFQGAKSDRWLPGFRSLHEQTTRVEPIRTTISKRGILISIHIHHGLFKEGNWFALIRKKKYIKNERDNRARYNRMSVDQDWTNVWPTRSMFKQSAVPLPVRQGYVKNLSENGGLPPEKYANTELMKIPNFLHLTPLHIKKQCAAIKSRIQWLIALRIDGDLYLFE